MMDKLVLRRSDYNSYQSNWFYVWAVVFIIPFIVFLTWMYQISPKAFYGFLDTNTIPMFLLYGVGVFIYRFWLKKTYLEVSESGIRYVSGLPSFLGKYNPDWQKAWGEIQAVSVSEHVNLVNPELRHFFIRTNNADYKIFPTRWSDPNEKSDSFAVILKEKVFKKKQYVERKIKESPLYNIFEKKGFLRSDLEILKPKSEWTDINTSPIAMTMTGIFIFSLIYFITESYFTLSEYYASSPPNLWFIFVGILTAPVAFFFLKDSKLKPKEIGIMAILVACGIALVSYPMFLRINQWTDTEGLKAYTYTLEEDGRWKHFDPNQQLPNLIFDLRSSDYWKKFEINSEKDFELRKGGLGFYQVNMAPVYADQREYYEGK